MESAQVAVFIVIGLFAVVVLWRVFGKDVKRKFGIGGGNSNRETHLK